jgi:hypothetical protein
MTYLLVALRNFGKASEKQPVNIYKILVLWRQRERERHVYAPSHTQPTRTHARTHAYYHDVSLYSENNYFKIENYAGLIGLGRRVVG